MIPVGEHWRINLAAEGYNILNHPNFANATNIEGYASHGWATLRRG